MITLKKHRRVVTFAISTFVFVTLARQLQNIRGAFRRLLCFDRVLRTKKLRKAAEGGFSAAARHGVSRSELVIILAVSRNLFLRGCVPRIVPKAQPKSLPKQAGYYAALRAQTARDRADARF